MRACLALLAAVAILPLALSWSIGPLSGDDLAQFLHFPTHLPKTAEPNEILVEWLRELHPYLESIIPESKRKIDATTEYFAWIPTYYGAIPANGDLMKWSAPCFQENTAKATMIEDGSAIIEIEFKSPATSSCEDLYGIGTTEALHIVNARHTQNHTILWKGHQNASQIEWTKRNGYRVFRFNGTGEETLVQIYQTASLFFPALEHAQIPPEAMQRNVDFLNNQAYMNLTKRPIEVVQLNESQINNGDFFGVLRLDGLDPTLAWAMGADTGHTTIALRIDGELYICESTTKSNYWPTGHIQKTPYLQWLKQAQNATYNVVHLPLSPESQAIFNNTAAVEWFLNTAEGLPYGFHNMLYAWIDTAEDNYPSTLVGPTHEVLVGWVEQVSEGLAALMWTDAMNMRMGTKNLTVAEVYNYAYNYGYSFEQLFALPEQDRWVYGNGYSMVCDVLVCETWKAGGLFGNLTDDIQCTEFTNFDAYTLNIFDTNYVRPQECVEADPESPYCQILGPYRMTLPFYNSRPMLPYMADNCPRGPPPLFPKPAGC